MAEHTVARDRLDTIPGVGKRAAEVMIAELVRRRVLAPAGKPTKPAFAF